VTVLFGQFFLITEVAHIIGLLFPRKKLCSNTFQNLGDFYKRIWSPCQLDIFSPLKMVIFGSHNYFDWVMYVLFSSNSTYTLRNSACVFRWFEVLAAATNQATTILASQGSSPEPHEQDL
jgi:hypothetical protein